MSKINNDHGSGYAFGSDFSLSAFNAEQKQLKKRGRDDDMKTCRQTFAVPFNTKCANCDHILVKGLHGYMNRYRARDATTKKPLEYLRIPIWDVAFKCPRCGHNIIFRTDFETSHITAGYHVVTNGKRMAGDFHELMSKAAEAEEARKIEEAKTASIPEAERKGLENQRRKEEAAKLARFMEERRSSTSSGVSSFLHGQLLAELATPAVGDPTMGAPVNALMGGVPSMAPTGGEETTISTEDAMARLRLELGIVVGDDGSILNTDEDGELIGEDNEEISDGEGGGYADKDAGVVPPPSPSAAPSQDDLVDFFLGAGAAVASKPTVEATKLQPIPAPKPGASVVTPPPPTPPPAAVSNDDFFAQFS